MGFCFCIFSTIFIIAAAFKIYLKLTTGWCKSYTCLVGRTAIVTGANTGIGYWTALDFAKRGCKVILACRNQQRAEQAKKDIIKATKNEDVHVRILDLESLDSVRKFAKEFNESESRLDILVNNAGGTLFGDKFTEDKLQVLMQINYFSHVLLTDLLLDKLKKTDSSRIVNLSSMAAKHSKLTVDQLNKTPKQFMAEHVLYCHSKLCNILYTIELARRLKGTNVTVNAVHPGAVKTEFGRNFEGWFKVLFYPLSFLFFKSSEEGAQTTIHVSVSQEVEGVTGGLFQDCKQIPLYESATNNALVKQVWDKSRELLRLSK